MVQQLLAWMLTRYMTRIFYQDYEKPGTLCNDWRQPEILDYYINKLNKFKSQYLKNVNNRSQVSRKILCTWHWSEQIGISHIPQLCISARPVPFVISITFRHSTQTRFSPTLFQIFKKYVKWRPGGVKYIILDIFKSNDGITFYRFINIRLP